MMDLERKNDRLAKRNKKLMGLLQEIFNLIGGPWDDPVISAKLYHKIKKTLKK